MLENWMQRRSPLASNTLLEIKQVGLLSGHAGETCEAAGLHFPHSTVQTRIFSMGAFFFILYYGCKQRYKQARSGIEPWQMWIQIHLYRSKFEFNTKHMYYIQIQHRLIKNKKKRSSSKFRSKIRCIQYVSIIG